MSDIPASILGADVQFSFFFLVDKKFDDCEKVSLKWHRPFTKRKGAAAAAAAAVAAAAVAVAAAAATVIVLLVVIRD